LASRKNSSEAVQVGSRKRSYAPQPRHATAARGATQNQEPIERCAPDRTKVEASNYDQGS